MKTLIKTTLFFFFLALVFSNLYTFVSGIKLSEKINYYEQETRKLHTQNIELEKNVYEKNSLAQIASEAALLDFTKKVEPTHLDRLQYARRQ